MIVIFELLLKVQKEAFLGGVIGQLTNKKNVRIGWFTATGIVLLFSTFLVWLVVVSTVYFVPLQQFFDCSAPTRLDGDGFSFSFRRSAIFRFHSLVRFD